MPADTAPVAWELVRSERLLGELGLEVLPPGELEAWVARLEEAAAVVRVLPATRGGHSRVERLRWCGAAVAVLCEAGPISWARRGCGDRLCGHCGERRRAQLTAILAPYVGALDPGRLYFGTWTQPKAAGETTRAAVDRLLRAWTASRRAAPWTDRCVGGVRCIEVVHRRAGEQVGDHVVAVPGVHAHLHWIAELAPSVDGGQWCGAVQRRWLKVCPGAVAAAQQVGPVRGVWEVASYPFKGASGLAALLEPGPDGRRPAPGYVRGVLEGLHGRRLVEPWGRWRDSLDLSPPAPLRVWQGAPLARVVDLCALDRTIPIRFHEHRHACGDVLAAVIGSPRGLPGVVEDFETMVADALG